MSLTPSAQSLFGKNQKWIWLGLIILVVVILAVLAPRIFALYELYFSRSSIERLFYEDLGLSESWSSFLAVVFSFVYSLAWVPLTAWSYRLLAWKFTPQQLGVAFTCWVLVYGHVPLLHAVLGSDACFNQRTGAPTKWYVERPTGEIILFDSGGFETTAGVQKKVVTQEVCARFAAQRTNTIPKRVVLPANQIQFFDPMTGRARVWYAKATGGGYDLFDSAGYHPVTSEPLLPVTKDIIADILGQLERNAQEERRRSELEAQRRRQGEIDAQNERQREINAAADRAREAAEAPIRAERARREEEARRQREQEMAVQERIRAAQEAARVRAAQDAAYRSSNNGCPQGTRKTCLQIGDPNRGGYTAGCSCQ